MVKKFGKGRKQHFEKTEKYGKRARQNFLSKISSYDAHINDEGIRKDPKQ